MTVRQLYIDSEKTLFDGLSVTGVLGTEEELDYFFMLFGSRVKESFVPPIMRRAGHLNSIYDTVEEFKDGVAVWSAENVRKWNGLIKTTMQKYELVHNYDRTETITDRRTASENTENTETRSGEDNISRSVLENIENTETRSGEDNSTRNSSGNSSVENKVAAFDSSDYQSRDMSESSGTSSETGKNTSSGNASNTGKRDNTETGKNTSSGNMSNTGKRDNTETFERTIRAFGNIGVTTAQQMLEEERKLLEFNMFEYICNDFVKNFCIMVY